MDRKDLEAKVLQAVACVMPEIDISKLDMTAELTKDHWPNIILEFMMKSMKKSLKMISILNFRIQNLHWACIMI